MNADLLTFRKRQSPCVWHVGGADVHLRVPFLLELRRRGFEIGAVGSGDPAPFLANGISHWSYPLCRGFSPLADRRAMRRLRELFAVHQPDVLHAFDTKPGLLAPFAARDAGVPVRVRTITGMGAVFSSRSLPAQVLRPIYRLAQSRASRASNCTVFQNSDDQKYFRRAGLVADGCDALVRGSGVDLALMEMQRPNQVDQAALRRQIGAEGRLVVTMVARLVRHKGVLEFLRAAAAVRRRYPQSLFLLVGPRASEKSQAVAASVIDEFRNDARYLGYRQDIVSLLSISDVFVLPSYYREGVPRVLLEAGAMGLPLIATDMPGCRDVVLDGLNGKLVPTRNSAALAEAIESLLASGELRRQMAAASRTHVQNHFQLRTVVDAYVEIYDRLLKQTAPNRLGKAA